LVETGRSKGENVSMRNRLRIHHLLSRGWR
jgi:hypothetical protein